VDLIFINASAACADQDAGIVEPGDSPMTNFFTKTLRKLAEAIAARRRLSEFTCADCARSKQCGLPPNENCLDRIEQMSRDERVLRRRAEALAPW
jgi:hypothetical protein